MPPANAMAAAPLVLVCGADEFTVKQRAQAVYRQWCAELGGMDHEIIEAAAVNSAEALKALRRVREALNTLPFFGGAKALWFRDCTFLGDDRLANAQVVKESVAHLAQELKGFAWQNVRLLISAGAVDRRKVFYKTLEKAGRVEDHAALAEDCDWAVKAEQWAENLVQEQGKRIQANALAELVNRVGPNLRQLFNEAEKLVTYVGTRPQITLADVAAVSAHNKQAKAFALGDALGDRKLPELLQRLDEELWGMQFDRDRSEIGLLYGLVTKVRALIFAKEMLREGWLKPGDDYPRIKARLPQMPAAQWPADKRFNPASLNAYVLFKAMNQAKNFTQAELVRALELLLECNLRLVTTSEEEKRVMQQTLTAMVGQGGRWAG